MCYHIQTTNLSLEYTQRDIGNPQPKIKLPVFDLSHDRMCDFG